MTAPDFHRFAVPSQICECEHSRPRHNPSLKNEPCEACPCRSFDHRWNDWRETRIVREAAS